MQNKERLDKILVSKGYADNPSKAKALIMAGKIIVNGKKIDKSGIKFLDNINIRVLKKEHEWVSRGGIKLSNAIKNFNINLDNKVCVDIGASTGGFTEVLLKNNAAHVYCIDVGRGQLNWNLMTNKKVTVLDKTNARNVSLQNIDKRITVIACDLSFISIKKALTKIIQFNKSNVSLIALVKPQFELSKDKIGKNGIVTNSQYRNEAIQSVSNWLKSKNWDVIGLKESFITGAKGNREYFLYCIKKLV